MKIPSCPESARIGYFEVASALLLPAEDALRSPSRPRSASAILAGAWQPPGGLLQAPARLDRAWAPDPIPAASNRASAEVRIFEFCYITLQHICQILANLGETQPLRCRPGIEALLNHCSRALVNF